jgi:hypothetical protein
MGICCCLLDPQTNSGAHHFHQRELQRMHLRMGRGRKECLSRLSAEDIWRNGQITIWFINSCFNGIITAMFETFQSPHPEPVQGWLSPRIYIAYCVVGATCVLIGFWKYGTSRPLGLVCYSAMSVLALYFFVAARTARPTPSAISTRCVVLTWLSLIPSTVHMLLMK